MSSDERSPKRQRLSSYSPASTPTETKSTPFVQHPNTPPPSVHMSPSWQSGSQLPGLGMAGNGGSGNGGGVNFPTPPSPAGAGYQSQSVSMAQSVGSEGGSARQTPAAEGDMEMQEGAMESGDGDVSMTEDGEHRRTDHERTAEDEDIVAPSPNTFGVHYLPTEPITQSQPHPSQNLLALYNLTTIQSSVARKDPVTGAKINKLRKSYEGKVKDLGLEGRNKANKNMAELENFVDPEWDIVIPDDGRIWWEVRHAESVEFSERGAEGMLGMLGSALGGLKPGRLPRAEDTQWKNLLGLDDSSVAKAPNPPAVANTAGPKTAANHFLSKTSPATAVQRSAPASPRSAAGTGRPERSGKKRSYVDASFEGYEEDGYSTGDGGGREGANKRQKRKDFPAASSSTSPPYASSNSGNSNMVGVRSL